MIISWDKHSSVVVGVGFSDFGVDFDNSETDLGPFGGDEGGHLVFKGTPEDLIKEGKSLLSSHLKPKLSG